MGNCLKAAAGQALDDSKKLQRMWMLAIAEVVCLFLCLFVGWAGYFILFIAGLFGLVGGFMAIYQFRSMTAVIQPMCCCSPICASGYILYSQIALGIALVIGLIVSIWVAISPQNSTYQGFAIAACLVALGTLCVCIWFAITTKDIHALIGRALMLGTVGAAVGAVSGQAVPQGQTQPGHPQPQAQKYAV